MTRSYRSSGGHSDAAERIKEAVSIDRAVRFYGFEPNRSGYICCPFHQEKTASLKIYPDGWHCFGCHKGGSVIDFVMNLFNLSLSETYKRISADFGVELEYNPKQAAKARQRAILDKWEQDRERREEFEERRRLCGYGDDGG